MPGSSPFANASSAAVAAARAPSSSTVIKAFNWLLRAWMRLRAAWVSSTDEISVLTTISRCFQPGRYISSRSFMISLFHFPV